MFFPLLPPQHINGMHWMQNTRFVACQTRPFSSALPPASEGWRNIKLIACLLDAKRRALETPQKGRSLDPTEISESI